MIIIQVQNLTHFLNFTHQFQSNGLFSYTLLFKDIGATRVLRGIVRGIYSKFCILENLRTHF